ncbi:MAG: AarF/UbiB family protein [Verrucomicrobiota bacterium]|nr:AarF/UbiB family protein [Verrucomicrobiota bacterium]
MKISLKPHHLKRYKDIARLFIKYGRSDVVSDFGLDSALDDGDRNSARDRGEARPEELADDLEAMGPTYIKLGQLLSSRADLLPERYLKPLARLQDSVKPFPYEQVEQILLDELGVRISKAFSQFDPEPLAAASLGQVHKAALRDGRPVVVKILRPGIRKQIAEDMEVLEEISDILGHTKAGKRFQYARLFEEFKRTLVSELDYTREAASMTSMARNLAEFPHILIPLPIHDYTTRSVLTMEHVTGVKITKVSPLARLELNGSALAEELFKAYLKQVLLDGLFHADPHPGNVFLTHDKKIALLDLGMVGRLSPGMQEQLIKILVAISEGNSEEVASLAINIGETTESFNEVDFRRRTAQLVAEQKDNTLQQLDIGRALLEVGRSAGEAGLYIPTELSVLGKTLLQLDEIGKALDPEFNPNASIRRNVAELVNRRMRSEMSTGKMFSSLLDMKDFVGALPRRLNKILDSVANAELEVKVKATDANLLLAGFQKIANRITTGLILAALIIGASLLMNIRTSFQLFGYPGLAILCFLLAAGGGFWLVFTIFISDHKDQQRNERKN